MAFHVCYHEGTSADSLKAPALYLDQEFYELIHRVCLPEASGYDVLQEMAGLRYKSPELIVGADRIDGLVQELAGLADGGHRHPQIEAFRAACAMASERAVDLVIAADMYREL